MSRNRAPLAASVKSDLARIKRIFFLSRLILGHRECVLTGREDLISIVDHHGDIFALSLKNGVASFGISGAYDVEKASITVFCALLVESFVIELLFGQ